MVICWSISTCTVNSLLSMVSNTTVTVSEVEAVTREALLPSTRTSRFSSQVPAPLTTE